MGQVDVPLVEVLKEMHESQCILRAAEGTLSKVPVEKVLLPHSNDMNPKGTQVGLGPDGSVYVRQSQLLCKSTDGGRTWVSQPLEKAAENLGWHWKVLNDGTFINVSYSMGPSVRDPAIGLGFA